MSGPSNTSAASGHLSTPDMHKAIARVYADRHGADMYDKMLTVCNNLNKLPEPLVEFAKKSLATTAHENEDGTVTLGYPGGCTPPLVAAIRDIIGDEFPDLKLPISRKKTITMPDDASRLLKQRIENIVNSAALGDPTHAIAEFEKLKTAAKLSRDQSTRAANDAKAARRAAAKTEALPASAAPTRTAPIPNPAIKARENFETPFGEMDTVIALLERLNTPNAKLGDAHRTNGAIKLGTTSQTQEIAVHQILQKLAGTQSRGVMPNQSPLDPRPYFVDVSYDARETIGKALNNLKADRARVMHTWDNGEHEDAKALQKILLETFDSLALPSPAITALPRVGGRIVS